MRPLTILIFLASITSCATVKQVPVMEQANTPEEAPSTIHEFKRTSVFDSKNPNGSISGRVIDEETGEPVLFASVALLGSDGKFIEDRTTNIEGLFIFSDLSLQQYTIAVLYVGYKEIRIENLQLRKGETIDFSIPMTIQFGDCIHHHHRIPKKEPIIKEDKTTSGATFTKEFIKRMAW